MSQLGNKYVESPVVLGYVEITGGHTAAAKVGFDSEYSVACMKPAQADMLVRERSSDIN
jgi:hypothetical protein